MESSLRDLFIDMVVDRFIFKNDRLALFSCFTLPKTGVGLPKTGVSFYRALVPPMQICRIQEQASFFNYDISNTWKTVLPTAL